MATALLRTPIQDARLSAFGKATARPFWIPNAVGGAMIDFVPSGAWIFYGVASWPDDLLDGLNQQLSVNVIQTRPGPKWLPGRSVVVTSSGDAKKGKITKVAFLDGAVGVIAAAPSTSGQSSRGDDRALVLARVALDHLHRVEREIGWQPVSLVNVYRVPSSSMEPTLHCARPGSGCLAALADHVRAKPYGQTSPKRGEIVVFTTPHQAVVRCGAGGIFIKRLIALPGETWQQRNGYIYINGKKLIEPYVAVGRRDTATSYSVRKIPAGHYFLMGDNRKQSCDSREFGPVPRANLIGKGAKIERVGP